MISTFTTAIARLNRTLQRRTPTRDQDTDQLRAALLAQVRATVTPLFPTAVSLKVWDDFDDQEQEPWMRLDAVLDHNGHDAPQRPNDDRDRDDVLDHLNDQIAPYLDRIARLIVATPEPLPDYLSLRPATMAVTIPGMFGVYQVPATPETPNGAAIPTFTLDQVRHLAAESATYSAARPGVPTDSVLLGDHDTVWVDTRHTGPVRCRPDADGRYPIALPWKVTSTPAAGTTPTSPAPPHP